VRGEATANGSLDAGGGAGGGASATSGGVAVVSGATFVRGLESAGCGMGVVATGVAALTDFCSHPVIASANAVPTSTTKLVAFLLRLGIYLFSSARSFPAEASRDRANGNSIRKVVPRPTSESNSIRPLCNCTNRNVLASPIPVPPCLVVKNS